MHIVDTSVWIETFRARNPLRLADVVDPDAIVTCLPVIQEVLQGFRDERAYRLAREAMLGACRSNLLARLGARRTGEQSAEDAEYAEPAGMASGGPLSSVRC